MNSFIIALEEYCLLEISLTSQSPGIRKSEMDNFRLDHVFVVARPPPLVMGWEGAPAWAGGQEGH